MEAERVWDFGILLKKIPEIPRFFILKFLEYGILDPRKTLPREGYLKFKNQNFASFYCKEKKMKKKNAGVRFLNF